MILSLITSEQITQRSPEKSQEGRKKFYLFTEFYQGKKGECKASIEMKIQGSTST